MRTKHLLGSLCVSLAMFALPAAAETPGQTTPASSGMCDDLADNTPGLQGLCVALCEAQACVAEINPVTGKLEFGPDCEPSSDELLANYIKLANTDPEKGPVDPPPPCIEIACPCWTEKELTQVGDGQFGSCANFGYWTVIDGNSRRGPREFAQAVDYSEWEGKLQCSALELDTSFGYREDLDMSDWEFLACQESIVKECARR